MEVQGRAVPAPVRLSALAARAAAPLALGVVLALAVVVVAAQPVRSPWWTYADADATYTGSALNMLLGEEVTFVDHPGLPLTEAAAVAFGVDALVEEGSLKRSARLRFVDRSLLDLDRTRGVFRGLAIAIYLAGALAAFLLATRLFGHWTWGLANGVLWLAAPGLAPMSIQLRPDVLLAALCLVFAFLVARAVERRSPGWFAASAALIGFAVMVKLHALALLAPLVVAAVWRRPSSDEVAHALRRFVGRLRSRSRWALVAVVPWLALVVLLNWDRFPFTPSDGQLAVGLLTIAALLGAGLAFRVPRLRFAALLALTFLGGVLLPVTLDVQDGVRSLVYLARNLSGQGVQAGVEPFSTPVSALESIVGLPVVLVLFLCLAAGVVGLVRREPVPVVWAVGALAAGTFAYARPPAVHYFAPAFVLAALALLWLLQREPRASVPLLAWVVVAYVFLPEWDRRDATAAFEQRFAASVEPAKRYVEPRLAAGEVAIVPSNWPFADSRYFELVHISVAHSPPYPYRYLPLTEAAEDYARREGLRARFAIGFGTGPVGDFGTFRPTGAANVSERVGG